MITWMTTEDAVSRASFILDNFDTLNCLTNGGISVLSNSELISNPTSVLPPGMGPGMNPISMFNRVCWEKPLTPGTDFIPAPVEIPGVVFAPGIIIDNLNNMQVLTFM